MLEGLSHADSQDLAASILASCPDCVHLLSADGTILFINAQGVALNELDAVEDVLGKNFADLWPEDEREKVRLAIRGAAEGRATSLEGYCPTAKGASRWWEVRFAPLPPAADAGGPTRIVGISRDISARHDVETASRATEERLRSAEKVHRQSVTLLRNADERLRLALSVGQGIGTWDWDVPNDRVVTDERFAKIYGVDPDKARNGAPIADFFEMMHPEDLPAVQAAISEALRTGEDFSAEYRLVQEDGSVRWVAAQGRCSRGPDGQPLRFPGITFDVTKRRKADALRDGLVQLTKLIGDVDDAKEIVFAASKVLGETLNVSRVGYGTIDAVAGTLTVEKDWLAPGVETLAGTLNLRDYGSFIDDLKLGKFISIADVEKDDRTAGAAQALKERSAGSFVNVPVLEQGKLVAVLFINNAAARDWQTEELVFFREVAERTRTASDRLLALEALRESESRLRAANETLEAKVELRTHELMQAEKILRQSQKMEAVGQLTGGIAHDFNNMLTVVIGSLELMKRRAGTNERMLGLIDTATEGARRATLLTQRLLAFSRQQPLQPEPIDLNRLVTGMSELLARSLGGAIRLETVLAGGLWRTNADPNQLENVILNLGVNGRDAMPGGGKLTIETQNAHLDERYAAAHPGIPEGQYVLIAVTDTGVGMPADVVAKAFDPFFTTKEVGKGTGLGLSQVYGFVRQSGGHVKIYSELGHGTTVKVYLPRLFDEKDARPAAPTVVAPSSGQKELILVVEDEPAVRAVSVAALKELGYTVVQADGAAQALLQLEAHPNIELMFTDVVMPDVNGRQLAEEACRRVPTLKVLFTTGYTRNAVVHNGTIAPGVRLLGKPFTIDELARKIREALDHS